MNKTNLKKTVTLLGVFAFFSVISMSAQTIVGWDFDPLTGGTGNFGPSPFAAVTVDDNISTSGLVRGSGVGSTTNSGAANAWGGNDFNITTPSFASAISSGDFATFTVVADAGYEFSLSTISAYNIRRSSSGPSSGQWQYSLNGTDFVDIGTAITWGGTTSASGNAQSAIDLTGIGALQSIGSVTFRVVTWGATTTGGTWYFNDPSNSVGIDFGIVGSVSAIPEPSAYAAIFGAIALAGVATRRRRV